MTIFIQIDEEFLAMTLPTEK